MNRKPHAIPDTEIQRINPLVGGLIATAILLAGAAMLGAAFNLGWHLIAGAC